jgi:hypothetical protein
LKREEKVTYDRGDPHHSSDGHFGSNKIHGDGSWRAGGVSLAGIEER